MGRYLAQQYSGFSAIITVAANKAFVLTGYPVLPFLVDKSAPRGLSIDQSEVAQICIFIFQYSVCTWLESLGIHAHAVLGHSLGEIEQVCSLLMSQGFFFLLLLTDLISDCSGFQFRSWFAVRGRQGYPSPRRSCSSSPRKRLRVIFPNWISTVALLSPYTMALRVMWYLERWRPLRNWSLWSIRMEFELRSWLWTSPSIAPALPALKHG